MLQSSSLHKVFDESFFLSSVAAGSSPLTKERCPAELETCTIRAWGFKMGNNRSHVLIVWKKLVSSVLKAFSPNVISFSSSNSKRMAALLTRTSRPP